MSTNAEQTNRMRAAQAAVHTIASVEPAVDEAIELFADSDEQLTRIPARQTIMHDVCELLAIVAQADGVIANIEMTTYAELLDTFSIGEPSYDRLHILLGAGPDSGGPLANAFESSKVVKLLQLLDARNGTRLADVYIEGVTSLLRFFADVDGVTSESERGIWQRR